MTFQEENNQLLKSIIHPFYFFWRLNKEEQEKFNSRIQGHLTFEIFVTPRCNQACSYCYLVKHGNELYPFDLLEEDKLVKNLDILLDYCLTQGFRFPKFDIFSGEILGTSLGNRILAVILKYLRMGLQIDMIVIPSNCSFILNPKATQYIQKFIDEAKSMNCIVNISASVDGKYLEEKTRNFVAGHDITEKLKTEQFYDKLFEFLRKNNLGVHPMVAAKTVKYWPENYDWWVNVLKKTLNREKISDASMYLEVRDNNWSDENIEDYIKFLNHMVEVDLINDWKGAEDEMLAMILPSYSVKRLDGRKIERRPTNYVPYRFSHKVIGMGCSAQHSLSVRLGDLAIYPCHRTCYDKFIYGNFVVENDKIVDINAKNVLLANRIINQSTLSMMNCASCTINNFCIRGCYGAQYENSKEIFYPCDTVCKLEKVKFLFIYNKAKSIYDRFNLSEKLNLNMEEIKEVHDKLLEEEEFQKWEKKIGKILSSQC